MLNEICGCLKNFFIEETHIGHISVVDGFVYCDGKKVSISEGQYFTLVNEKSKAILGTYLYGTDELKPRDFYGAVWLMDIPDDLIVISEEISDWVNKYGGANSSANSPYNSETYAGYSYSKTTGGTGKSSNTPAWWTVYGGRLSRWRKIQC